MALLDNARSMIGPLDPKYRRLIYAYLQKPTFEGWDRIYCVVIRYNGPSNTVWQALAALDSSYTNIGRPAPKGATAAQKWSRIPDGVTLARAIKRVLDKTP